MKVLSRILVLVLALLFFQTCRQHDQQVTDEIIGENGLVYAELFKVQDSLTMFWRIREIPGRNTLSVQEGILGGKAGGFEIYKSSHVLLVQKARDLVSGMLKEDYVITGPDAFSQLIIQIDTSYWGDPEDIDRLVMTEDLLNKALISSGNGKCTGSDYNAKVSFYAVVFDADIATKTILAVFRETGIDLPVVIAVEKGNDIQVIWPENFQGAFSLI